MQACKPGPVPGNFPGFLPFIWDGCHHPPQSIYPIRLSHTGKLSEQPSIPTYVGIAELIRSFSP